MDIKPFSEMGDRPGSKLGELAQDKAGNTWRWTPEGWELTGFRLVDVPKTAKSPGTVRDVALDHGHIYFCVSPNHWKRAALKPWK